MKKLLLTLTIVFSIFWACKNHKETNTINIDTTQNIVQKQDTVSNIIQDIDNQKEFTSKFICPNRCKGSGSSGEGRCPICGMDYIENPDFQ